MVVALYPKFPLIGFEGVFVAIRLEDILIALVVGIYLLFNWRNLISDAKKPIHRAILLYWLVSGVSTFAGIFLTKTVDPKVGLLHFGRRIEYMSMFWVGYWAFDSMKNFSTIIRSILVTALVVAIFGLGQQFLAWPVISTSNSEFAKGLTLSLGPGARINSTFAGHYDLAAFCLFPLLIIIWLATSETTKKRWLLALVGIPLYWAMLLSASRITFAAFIVTAFLMIVIFKKWRWLVVLFVVSVLSVFLSPQLAGRYRELIITRFNQISFVSVAHAEDVREVPDALKPTEVLEDRSLNIRLKASWPKAIRALYKNPVLGTGFSSVGLAIDNDYLRQLAETGILGTLALALIYIRLAKSWLFSKNKFTLVMSCVTVGLLANAVFIDIFEASKIAIVFWLLAGVTQKLKSWHEIKNSYYRYFINGVAVRLYKITSPIGDWHSWRQADTSAVTRNFVKYGSDLLHPDLMIFGHFGCGFI